MNEREPLEAWENELHRELRALPDLNAPPSLIPGVLKRLPAGAAASVPAGVWWRWPLGLRLASMALVVAVLAGLAWVSGTFLDFGLGLRLAEAHTSAKATLALALDRTELVLGPNAAFWRQHGQMILILSATLLIGLYLTCLAAGSTLYRLAWRRIS